ncbi:MAG TPA: FAD-dependent oxidoreductase [Gaiellaceae bacterium]|jgi:NTE family protein|nr:FAD-dependent oxidoreductase [Gaiellaceae bacterium]
MGTNGNGLVVVGGGLASARAIKSFRESGGEGPVTLFSLDDVVPYHRPPLSKRFLRGEAEREDTFVEPEQFYREHDVDVHLEQGVRALRTGERTLELEGGSSKRFDKLLIASGATPRGLDVPGFELENVFTLRRLADSQAIRDAARSSRQAVVVGAGFIGMEVAASLSQLGLEVTLVHRGQGLFEILRARQVEQFLSELYGRHGVQLVLADEVAQFGGRGKCDSVETKRGQTFQADLAVVGIGVAPTTGWLKGSGLELDDGVVVNERWETGAEGVWAAGDVARFYDPIFGRMRRIEHWSNANYSGTEVGRLIASREGGFDIVSTFFSEVFGFTFKVFGDIDVSEEIIFRGALEDGKAIGFYLDGDRLVGCLLVGQDEETETRLKELIAAHARPRTAAALADESTPLDDAFEVAASL